MAKADSTGSSEVAIRPYQTLVQKLAGQADLNAGLGVDDKTKFELQAAAIDNIAQADTLDAIFDANEQGSLPGAEEAATKGPLTLIDIEFRKSADQYRAGGLGVYAFVSSYTDAGELFDWSTGAPNIVASLYRVQELGLMNKEPKPRLRVEAKKTTSGNTLYRLARP